MSRHQKKSGTKVGKAASKADPLKSGAPSTHEITALFALLNEKRYAEGERRARVLTVGFPRHGLSWKVLAAMLQAQGRMEEALVPAQKTVQLLPGDVEAHNNLGGTFLAQHRLTEAEACYRQALALQPTDAKAHNNLGTTLQRQGRLAEAEVSLRHALALQPNLVEAHTNLGTTLHEQGQLAEAEACYRQALALQPHLAGVHNNLGRTLEKQGRLSEAEASLRHALALRPDYVEAHNSLGTILTGQGRLAEAEASLRHALALQPDYAAAHTNLGTILLQQGRLAEAELRLRRALAFRPDYAEAHSNLGTILLQQGRLAEAEISLRHALVLQPNLFEAHANLGNALVVQGRLAEAEASLRQVLTVRPDFVDAQGILLFIMNFNIAHTPIQRLEEARRYGRMVAEKVTERFTAWTVPASPERLRVGLVSGDLRNHSVGHLLESLIAAINPASIELIAYPTQPQEDDLTARLRPAFAAWKPLFGQSDQDAARLIHADGVHILLDLSGYTQHSRLPMFAWKPAPVQVSWLGYFATTGIAEMDYFLGDGYVAPHEEAAHFTETVWRLPENYLCFTPPAFDLTVGPLPAQATNGITFGNFNNLSKMNDQVVDLWARVLQAIPGSRLLLKTKQLDDSSQCEITRQRFAAQGIAADRLILEGASPRAELLAAYNRVDIALDPFPYTGGVTSLEALWMGVPVLTRRGDRFLSHVGETIASNAGLTDWIAADDDDYVNKAVAHTANLEYLATLRAGLRQQVLASPLFDAPRFARHFEAALWGMWKIWQEQQGITA